uniref:Uncharacterized protein n=1 Tax=Romanomermis culicivorax TaxID=13658 RepID=A0A915IFK0_ROMCU
MKENEIRKLSVDKENKTISRLENEKNTGYNIPISTSLTLTPVAGTAPHIKRPLTAYFCSPADVPPTKIKEIKAKICTFMLENNEAIEMWNRGFMEEGNSPTPRKCSKAPSPKVECPKLAAVDHRNFKNVVNSIHHRPGTPSAKRAVFAFLIILFVFVGQSTSTLLVQVSTPFDPYRLECPRKFGVVKLIVQKIQSVGRLRDDLMVAAFCRNITEIYPSPFDRHFVEDDEDCRWTTPVELPGPDFTFRNACSDREFLAGISRQESTQYEFLCCRNRDKKRKKCFANRYNYPLSHDLPEVVIERKGLLITSLAYQ